VDFDFSYFDFFLVLALSDLGFHRGTAGTQAPGYAESSETMKTEDYPPSPQEPRGARSEWCGSKRITQKEAGEESKQMITGETKIKFCSTSRA
jgi:hypothetical protein